MGLTFLSNTHEHSTVVAAPAAKSTTKVDGNGAAVAPAKAGVDTYTQARFQGINRPTETKPAVSNAYKSSSPNDSRNAQFLGFQADAPSCDQCGI